MTGWRWTCEKCRLTGVLDEDWDPLFNPAMAHVASHAKGPFDIVPAIELERVESPG